jgi:hypothetical protein
MHEDDASYEEQLLGHSDPSADVSDHLPNPHSISPPPEQRQGFGAKLLATLELTPDTEDEGVKEVVPIKAVPGQSSCAP